MRLVRSSLTGVLAAVLAAGLAASPQADTPEALAQRLPTRYDAI